MPAEAPLTRHSGPSRAEFQKGRAAKEDSSTPV